MFLRYRDIKFWDPFLAKNGPFSLNIYQNPENIPNFGILHDTNHGDTWKITKTKSKTIFWLKKIIIWTVFRYIFIPLIYIVNGQFPPYQAALKREYLKLGFEF